MNVAKVEKIIEMRYG